MIISGKRRTGTPILREPDGSITRPKRISFTQKTFDEGWIQELIRANPELLPVDEIEPVFSPLVAIGREVSTNAGPIDNLYLSPQGYLTIVETKLWRNPEARREVVGQIIDYAKEISKWSYNELEERVRSYNQQYRGTNSGIIETLQLEQEDIEEDDESFFIDTVSRNIQQGRFLLLIVGDGIRESVEDMIDFLAQTPQLQFTLALVELQIYELDSNQDQSLLIIPQVVTRTREITRAIVKVEAKEVESITIDVVEKDSSDSEEIFFNALSKSVSAELVMFARSIIKDIENLGCIIEWHSASYVMKLPAPSGRRFNLSIIGVYKYGQVFIGGLANQLKKLGLPEQIGLDYAKSTASLFNCGIDSGNPTEWARMIELRELQQRYDDFKHEVEKTINQIIDASNEVR
jgi:hypothetical protein